MLSGESSDSLDADDCVLALESSLVDEDEHEELGEEDEAALEV